MRLSVRWHAARHSAFDMCVAGSQNPMQSLSVLPPPPGELGAVSLGCRRRHGRELPAAAPCFAGTPPPEETTGGTGGESGATLGT